MVLDEQLISGVQGAEAGNHENSRHGCPFGVGDDASIVLLAISQGETPAA